MPDWSMEMSNSACEEEIRTFAMKVPSLERAAREGYKVSHAFLQDLAKRIADIGEDESGIVLAPGALHTAPRGRHKEKDRHARWAPRNAPHPATLVALDRVRKRIATLADQIPRCVSIDVRGVVRFWPANVECNDPITSVLVVLVCSISPDIAIVFPTED